MQRKIKKKKIRFATLEGIYLCQYRSNRFNSRRRWSNGEWKFKETRCNRITRTAENVEFRRIDRRARKRAFETDSSAGAGLCRWYSSIRSLKGRSHRGDSSEQSNTQCSLSLPSVKRETSGVTHPVMIGMTVIVASLRKTSRFTRVLLLAGRIVPEYREYKEKVGGRIVKGQRERERERETKGNGQREGK